MGDKAEESWTRLVNRAVPLTSSYNYQDLVHTLSATFDASFSIILIGYIMHAA